MDKITLLQEQLREKDRRIADLEQKLHDLTKCRPNDEESVKEPEQDPGFWERHVVLSYVILFIVAVLGIVVILSPLLWPALWKSFGKSMGIIYIYSSLIPIAFEILAWFNTPKGRKWLKEL